MVQVVQRQLVLHQVHGGATGVKDGLHSGSPQQQRLGVTGCIKACTTLTRQFVPLPSLPGVAN